MKLKKHLLTLSSLALLFGASAGMQTIWAQEESSEEEVSLDTSVNNEESQTEESVEEPQETSQEGLVIAETADNEGRLPANIKIKREPKFKVGDDVRVLADHHEGMKDAEGKIVAAFETTAYEISYDPSDGSERVENHRWIVHEEIANAQEEVYQVDDEILVNAHHMEGMEGVTATITDVNTTTVYLVDYVDTVTGELVINHKWVTEDELAELGAETEEETTAPTEDSEKPAESEEETSESDEESDKDETPEDESSEEGSEEESSEEECSGEESSETESEESEEE